MENNSRRIKNSEISLENLIFWGDDEHLWFTCLQEVILVLDGTIVQCRLLEEVQVGNKHRFEIKSQFGHISSSEINQKLQSYTLDNSYNKIRRTGNNFQEDIADNFALQDFVDTLTLDKKGNFHPWKIAGGVSTILGIVSVGCTVMCCCSAKLRDMGKKCVPTCASAYMERRQGRRRLAELFDRVSHWAASHRAEGRTAENTDTEMGEINL